LGCAGLPMSNEHVDRIQTLLSRSAYEDSASAQILCAVIQAAESELGRPLEVPFDLLLQGSDTTIAVGYGLNPKNRLVMVCARKVKDEAEADKAIRDAASHKDVSSVKFVGSNRKAK
jgi:hypothetical protein